MKTLHHETDHTIVEDGWEFRHIDLNVWLSRFGAAFLALLMLVGLFRVAWVYVGEAKYIASLRPSADKADRGSNVFVEHDPDPSALMKRARMGIVGSLSDEREKRHFARCGDGICPDQSATERGFPPQAKERPPCYQSRRQPIGGAGRFQLLTRDSDLKTRLI